MQSLSRPSVKCGNSVSKLGSDPIPSVELGPGSKWAGSRRRGFCRGGGKERRRGREEGVGGGGGGENQLTDVVPHVQEPCLFSAGELEEGPGLGAGREISGSCLRVQIPPPMCLCGGEAVAQLP